MARQFSIAVEPELRRRLDDCGPNRSAAARDSILAGLPMVESANSSSVPVSITGKFPPGDDGGPMRTRILVDLPERQALILAHYWRDAAHILKHFNVGDTECSLAKPSRVAQLLVPEVYDLPPPCMPSDPWDAMHVLGSTIDAFEQAVWDMTRQPGQWGVRAPDLWRGIESLDLPLRNAKRVYPKPSFKPTR